MSYQLLNSHLLLCSLWGTFCMDCGTVLHAIGKHTVSLIIIPWRMVWKVREYNGQNSLFLFLNKHDLYDLVCAICTLDSRFNAMQRNFTNCFKWSSYQYLLLLQFNDAFQCSFCTALNPWSENFPLHSITDVVYLLQSFWQYFFHEQYYAQYRNWTRFAQPHTSTCELRSSAICY